ncbi:MAG: hypothetical protein JSS02_20565 [Planctomycetes bacterium]|nr:hypothetical protein [Planctomycetota bacterium]
MLDSRTHLSPSPQPAATAGRFRRWVLASLALAVIFAPAATWAQLPQARLNAVFPTGGQRGTAFDLTLAGGTDLDEASQLFFSHPGITAVQKTQMVDGQPQPIANTFTVTIAGDVPVGIYDVRARSLFGLSNPRAFTVGDRKELNEVEPNNTADKPMAVELNTVINGRSDGGADLDWFKFSAKAGQRIILELKSKALDSRMEGALEIYNVAGTTSGRRLAHRRTLGSVEPVLDFTVPADGDYLVKVYDFLFTGSAEYFYRLALHTGPHIDYVLPTSGLPNTTAEYTVYGRNLPGGQPSTVKADDGKTLEQLKVAIALPADPSLYEPGEPAIPAAAGVDGITWTLASPAGTSNPVTIFFASGPAGLEQEPNDTPDKAQKITVPADISGQFQARRDVDLFQFDAKAGDVFWIDVFGQRNHSPADPVLIVDQVKKNDKGEETLTRITALDDTATNIGATLFNTTTDDPVFRFAAPGEGTFRITLRDRAFESRGAPHLTYRLSIHKESPDFRIVAIPAVPSSDPNAQAGQWDLGIRKGDNAQITVMAFRNDGFTGVIDVTAEGLPAGVTTAGASIGPTQTSATLVLTATEQAADWHGPIRIIGKGRLEDPALVKAVTDQETAKRGVAAQISALDKAVLTATEALKQATEKAAAAKTALDGDANNDAKKKAKADADAAVTKATEEVNKANAAKAAGDKKLADLNTAIAAAATARDQAARDVTRVARAGTIVWPGNPGAQQAAQSRLARSLTLCVMKETAPYQLATDNVKFSVNQGSQILLPFRLAKRAGFDNNVTITFVAPPANLQVENKPINKGAADGLYRLYVANNVAPGTYSILAQTQTQVSYSRNPEAAALAAKQKEAADKSAAEAAEAAKKAAEAKAVADKKATDTAAEAKKAADAKVAADKLATETAAAAKAAADAKVTTDKAATDADAAAKAAVDAAAKAKEALDKDPNNDGLKKAKADADALVTKTADEAKKAAEAKAVADKKVTDTAATAKTAADAKAVADKAAADTDALAKKAVEEKTAADKLAAETDQKSKAAAAAKAAADKKATDTANASKPNNVNTFFPAAALTITVKPAPGTLALAPANNGAVKRGTNLEVKATITRTNGFAGPVTLSLPLPPGVAGLSAAPVTIPADKNEGVLVITAGGDATIGQLPNMVVRASMEFNGPAAIDQPVAINVTE